MHCIVTEGTLMAAVKGKMAFSHETSCAEVQETMSNAL